MSLRWRDEICIDVGPHRYGLTRWKRGLRPHVGRETSGTLVADAPGDWLPALAAVRRELDEPAWRQADVRVVVADHWARYAIVPWRPELNGDEERLAHGRLILRQVYGDDLAEWTLQLAQTVGGAPQLVCALPAALLSDIQQLLLQYKLRLVSLRPRLVVAFDRWRSRMPQEGGWFATVDDGRLTAVKLEGPHWAEVHSIRVRDDWAKDLNRLRAFGRLEHDGQPEAGRVLVDAPPHLRVAAEAFELEWLDAAVAGVSNSRWAGIRRGGSG